MDALRLYLPPGQYCNLFVNVWDDEAQEPMEPLDDPLTAAPKPSATEIPTQAPITAPEVEIVTLAPTVTPGDPTTCHLCRGAPKFICERAHRSAKCEHPEHQFCINEIENLIDGSRYVTRKCADALTCQKDWIVESADRNECKHYNVHDLQDAHFTCKFCCQGVDCNIETVPAVGLVDQNVAVYPPPSRRLRSNEVPPRRLQSQVSAGAGYSVGYGGLTLETDQPFVWMVTFSAFLFFSGTKAQNFYSTGNDHAYGPTVTADGLLIPVNQMMRFVKVWIGKNSMGDETGLMEIEPLMISAAEEDENGIDTITDTATIDVSPLPDPVVSTMNGTTAPATTAPTVISSSTHGDPHFKTWAGENYDFQ